MKKSIWQKLFLGLCALTLALCLPLFLAQSQNSSIRPSEPPVPAYRIQEYQGKIGIFQGSEKSPQEILEVPVDELPEGDRVLLKKGVSISTEEELQRYIEDYTS